MNSWQRVTLGFTARLLAGWSLASRLRPPPQRVQHRGCRFRSRSHPKKVQRKPPPPNNIRLAASKGCAVFLCRDDVDEPGKHFYAKDNGWTHLFLPSESTCRNQDDKQWDKNFEDLKAKLSQFDLQVKLDFAHLKEEYARTDAMIAQLTEILARENAKIDLLMAQLKEEARILDTDYYREMEPDLVVTEVISLLGLDEVTVEDDEMRELNKFLEDALRMT